MSSSPTPRRRTTDWSSPPCLFLDLAAAVVSPRHCGGGALTRQPLLMRPSARRSSPACGVTYPAGGHVYSIGCALHRARLQFCPPGVRLLQEHPPAAVDHRRDLGHRAPFGAAPASGQHRAAGGASCSSPSCVVRLGWPGPSGVRPSPAGNGW
eukprot:9076227-Pyramimonas_sp.AAC.1